MTNPETGIANPSTGIGHQIAQGGPTSITLQNASGAIVRTLPVVNGIATLAATDTLVTNGGVIPVKNSIGSVTNNANAIATVANGLLTQAALPGTVAFIADGASVVVRNSANTGDRAGTCHVSLASLGTVTLASGIAMVASTDTLVLQTNAGVVSSGTPGLNSPASVVISAGFVTAVKAAA